MPSKALVVFLSPAGSTRKVAEHIEQTLSARGLDVQRLDLGLQRKSQSVTQMLATFGDHDCLFIGSPVYRDVAPPPVMRFIEALPESVGCRAVPFITWGGACSGVALWQMGTALAAKKYPLAGALKITGTHSMMWRRDTPEGNGHPDARDLEAAARLCQQVAKNLENTSRGALDPAVLDYQSDADAPAMKKKIDQPWMIIPKTVHEDDCTQCGICEEACPVMAISLDPFPRFNDACCGCFNCIRLCPEDAIEPATAIDQIEAFIVERVKQFNENRQPVAFLP